MKRSLTVARVARVVSAVLRPAVRVRYVATQRSPRAPVARTHATPRRSYAVPAVPYTLVAMPALSPTMETGTLVRWAKKEGDKVEPGDLIAEVETDKATIGWESTEDGVIAKLLVAAPAQGLKIGAPVAIFTKTAADAKALANVTLADFSAAPAPAAAAAATPAAPAAPATPRAAAPSTSAKALPKRVLTMPALSPTMEKGTLAKWGKQSGERIEPGDLIAEVETDKATIGWESTEDGFMAKQLVAPGSIVALGTPVAIIVDKKDDIAQWQSITAADLSAAPASPAAPSAPVSAAPASAPSTAPSSAAPSAVPSASSSSRVIASPRARMEAQQRGVPLDAVRGSGPNGRVIAADVLEYVPPVARAAPLAASAAASAAPQAAAVSGSQASWAARMLESKQRVPHYYLTVELRVDALERAVATLQTTHKDVTLSAALVLAAARAMAAVPAVNSEWRGDSVRTHTNVDVNFLVPGTVAGDNVQSPVVRAVQARGLRALSDDLRRVRDAAAKGGLSAQEQASGTFSVLDLSHLGVSQCAPIIVPNHAAALAFGAVETRPQLDADGESVRKTRVLVATLSCDHRVVDGAVGAQWLQQYKKLVEEPLTLLL